MLHGFVEAWVLRFLENLAKPKPYPLNCAEKKQYYKAGFQINQSTV
jgi:hypothetical protein